MALATRVDRWPVLGRHERAAEWLTVWADLGRAPRTIDAYARGLAEYLQVCERDGTDPLAAGRAQVAAFVREVKSRPGPRSSKSRRGRGVPYSAATGELLSGTRSTDPASAGREGRCSCRSRGATMPSR